MWYDNLPRLRGKLSQRWTSLMKWSITTAVLRLKEIRYCSIVARGSLKTLAYHSLPKYWILKIKYWINIEKNKNLETKCVTTSPGLPYLLRFKLWMRFFSKYEFPHTVDEITKEVQHCSMILNSSVWRVIFVLYIFHQEFF